MNSALDYWNEKHRKYKTLPFVTGPTFFAQEIVHELPMNARILELGSGQGADALFFASRGALVTATDFSAYALEQFKEKAEAAGVRQMELNLRSLPYPFAANGFDVVYAHLSVHYFDEPTTRAIFAEIARLLRPGGMFLAIFNSVHDPESRMGEELTEPRFRSLAPGDTKRFFTVEELAVLLGGTFASVDAVYGKGTTKNAEDQFVRLTAIKQEGAGQSAQKREDAIFATLGEAGSENPDRFGGKAATLAALSAAGFPVPTGVAISSESYLRHVLAITPPRPNGVTFAEWAENVRTRILEEPAPDEIANDIAAATAHLGPALIVRSSAVGEDSAKDSFAGQLDSLSDVDSENVVAAVRAVWASAWGPRAADYRERRGMTEVADLPVAVLVQEFVEPDLAGVLFTTSPTIGPSGAVVEAVRGRGQGLVDGTEHPVRYWLDSGGGVVQADDGREPLLDAAVADIHALGMRLVEMLRAPQDVEWVFKSGHLHVVQSRPITTLATISADPYKFRGTVVQVSAAEISRIPEELVDKDKFKLRLVASESNAAISRGWLISLTSHDSAGGSTLAEIAAQIESEVEHFPQVSIVLQRPARLHGEIIRQFSPSEELFQSLSGVVGHVGADESSFDLIVTEIYQAEKSGISHIVEDRLVVEVAYGNYVPKGVVPTALYVEELNGDVVVKQSPVQPIGIFIEAGRAVERPVEANATLTSKQLTEIRQLTSAVSSAYPDVSVEFGVLEDGMPYLIDIIPDMSPVGVDDVRVMSAGQITGTAHVAESAEFAEKSLNAHFHSARDATQSGLPTTVIVAPQPFLALEDYLTQFGLGDVGFVFEQGSLLGHLAIILREHNIPAIVVPDIRSRVRDGQILTIDTSTESLFEVLEATGDLGA